MRCAISAPPKRILRRSRPTRRAVTGPACSRRDSSGGLSRPYHHWYGEIGVVALIAAGNSFLCRRLSAPSFRAAPNNWGIDQTRFDEGQAHAAADRLLPTLTPLPPSPRVQGQANARLR